MIHGLQIDQLNEEVEHMLLSIDCYGGHGLQKVIHFA